jgi:iron complex outermembrane recepter protein
MLTARTYPSGAAMFALAVAIAAFPSQAMAQSAPGADEAGASEIIVTGSRIRRDPLNNDSPVVTLDQGTLAQTGLSAVADILQRLPSASGGLNSKVNNSGNLGNPPDGAI